MATTVHRGKELSKPHRHALVDACGRFIDETFELAIVRLRWCEDSIGFDVYAKDLPKSRSIRLRQNA